MQTTKQNKEARLPNGDGSFLTGQTLEGFSNSVEDLSNNVRLTSKEAAEKSISFVKKYPIHVTLGAVVVGFLIGSLSKKFK